MHPLPSCRYLLHETVMWSPYHKQWFVLPRRVSKDAYDEAEDERKGSNTIITASADFKSIKAHTVGVSRRTGVWSGFVVACGYRIRAVASGRFSAHARCSRKPSNLS